LHDGPSNPLAKLVVRLPGAWLNNYRSFPVTIAAPVAAIAAVAISAILLGVRRPGAAFIASGTGVAAVIATAGLSVFPFLLPSSLDPRMSLTVWDASSSRLTLMIMLWATAIFLPLILVYTTWVYRVLRGPITAAFVEGDSSTIY
jgi:cytochrome d ubiquinol oxidase subunit II